MSPIFIAVLLFVLGLIFIVKGGDFFVDAASWLAEVLGIPKFIIGATIVSIATTLPEIIVSLISAFEGKVDMAAGNAIGSVTVNIGFILGISVLFMPSAVKKKDFRLKALLMMAACLVLALFSQNGEFGLIPSALEMTIFLFFIIDNIKSSKDIEVKDSNKPVFNRKETISNVIKFVLGAAGIVIGAQLLVDNGSELARFAGVNERIIAVTIVAIGTSLPELVTTITALVKKQASLSIGNIIGANVIDLALILPLCAFVSKGSLPVSASTARIDIVVCFGIISLMTVPTLFTGKFKRWQGVVSIIAYIAYIAFTCFSM